MNLVVHSNGLRFSRSQRSEPFGGISYSNTGFYICFSYEIKQTLLFESVCICFRLILVVVKISFSKYIYTFATKLIFGCSY